MRFTKLAIAVVLFATFSAPVLAADKKVENHDWKPTIDGKSIILSKSVDDYICTLRKVDKTNYRLKVTGKVYGGEVNLTFLTGNPWSKANEASTVYRLKDFYVEDRIDRTTRVVMYIQSLCGAPEQDMAKFLPMPASEKKKTKKAAKK